MNSLFPTYLFLIKRLLCLLVILTSVISVKKLSSNSRLYRKPSNSKAINSKTKIHSYILDVNNKKFNDETLDINHASNNLSKRYENSLNKEIKNARNLQITTNEMTTYNDQASLLFLRYAYTTAHSVDNRKINSNIITIDNYIFLGEIYNSRLYIEVSVFNINSYITYTNGGNATYKTYSTQNKFTLSGNYLYLGDFIFLIPTFNSSENQNFYSNFFYFNTASNTFSVIYPTHRLKLIFPNLTFSQPIANLSRKYPYLINSVVNYEDEKKKMIFLNLIVSETLIDVTNLTNKQYFEVIISSCPGNIEELDTTSSTHIYEKYNFFEDTIIYEDSLSLDRKYYDAFFNSKIYVYSANVVLYLYTPSTFDSIGIAYWDYSAATDTPPFYNKQHIDIRSRVIISCLFEYNIINGIKYVSALMYVEDSGSYFVTLARFNLENPSQISWHNLQEFSTDVGLYLNFFKVTGPWIFYCSESPNECWSWLSNNINPLNLADSSHIAKLETTQYGNPSVSLVWYIGDILFHELPKYGEMEMYMYFYEITPGISAADGSRFVKFKLNNFILTNTYPDDSGDFNTLRCFLNQKYDSKSSNKCIDCVAETYGENNSCVSNCTTGIVTSMNYCSDTQVFETNTYSNSNGQYYNSETCSSNEVKINNSCVTCDIHSAIKQADLCEDSCRYGYMDCDGKTCHEGGCGCNPRELLENGSCVSSCSLKGLITNKNHVECIECSLGLYEADNTECVNSSSCPIGSVVETIGSYNDSARYCKYCINIGKYFENNLCVSSCTNPKLPNEDGNCVICTDYIIDNSSCSTTCPINKVKIDADKTCNSCSISTQYVLNQTSCEDNCPIGYIPETTDKYCYQCTTSPNLYINLDSNACVDSCNSNVEFLDTSIGANGKCVDCPGNYVYNSSCVSDCPLGWIKDSTNKYCIQCNGALPYINFSNNNCVNSCTPNFEYLDSSIGANGKCSNCPGQFTTSNGCVSTCPFGYSPDASNSFCQECSGTKPYINLSGGDCVNSCTNNLEYIDLSIKNGKCMDCPGQFTTLNGCVDECPEGSFPDSKNKYCVICSNPTPYININNDKCVSKCQFNEYIDHKISNGKCKMCDSAKYLLNENCVSKCPSNYFSNFFDRICELICNSSQYYDSINKVCLDSCDSNVYVINETEKTCIICSDLNKYKHNNSCVTSCPSDYIADNKIFSCVAQTISELCLLKSMYSENDLCVKSCSEGYYLLNNECISSCPSNYIISYTKDRNNKNIKMCVLCSNYHDSDGNCLDSCPNKTTPNNEQQCIPCHESSIKPYLLDYKCVSSCSEIYSIKMQGLYDVCILNDKTEKLTCSNYCNSNGNCSSLINGDLKCSCFNQFGNQCQLTTEELANISEIVTKELLALSNTSLNTERVKTETINDITDISSLLTKAPELISNEILTQLIDFINDILTNVENNITKADSSIYTIIDEVLKVKLASNNTDVSIRKLKEGTDALTKKILSGKNLSEITTNSSILYKGKSFSIQLADNNQESIDEARENSLPIVDYSLCESQLKSAGLLAEDEELYLINSSFDSVLNITEKNIGSGISDIISSSNAISSEVIDKNLNSINITSCSNFTFKLPVNKDSVGYDDYKKINDKLGVDIYNKSSEFFSDICFRFPSENNTDITVSGRRDAYNLTSACSDECSYNGIDEHGYSICLCESLHPSTSNLFESSIYENLLDNNIVLVKCVSEAFDSEYLISNLGFWVLFSSTIIISITIFIHLNFFKMKVIDQSLPKILYKDATFGIMPSKVGNVKDLNMPENVDKEINNNDRKEKIRNVRFTSNLNNNKSKNRKFVNHDIIKENSINDRYPTNSKLSSINTLITVNTELLNDNTNRTNRKNSNYNFTENLTNIRKLSENDLFSHQTGASYLQRAEIIENKNLLTLNNNEVGIPNEKNNNNNKNILNNTLDKSVNTINKINCKKNNNNNSNNDTRIDLAHNAYLNQSNNISAMNITERKKISEFELNKINTIEEESIQVDSIIDSKLEKNNYELKLNNKNSNILSLFPKNTSKFEDNYYSDSYSKPKTLKENSYHTPYQVGKNDYMTNNKLKSNNSLFNEDNNIKNNENHIINSSKPENTNNVSMGYSFKTYSSNKTMLARKSERELNRERNNENNNSNLNSNSTIMDNYLNSSSKNRLKASNITTRGFTTINSEMNTNSNNNQEINLDNENTKFNLDDITIKDVHSENDYNKLPLRIQLKIDDNSILSFFFHNLIHEHKFLNLFFLKSVINPLWIRLFSFLIELSLEFTFNAVFFSSSIINEQASVKSQKGKEAIGFWFIITNEFWKVFWPVVISMILMAPVNLIIKVPNKFYIQVNQYLITKDPNHVKVG